jgi:endogenous inhibitor of DNA gyrase (YacG/DUF329 family)
MTQSSSDQRAGAKCPICSRATDPKYRPFCSRRCADVDLARWLGGAYAIPDAGDSEDGDEQAEGVGEAGRAASPDGSGSEH